MTLYELEREKEGRKAAFRYFRVFLKNDLSVANTFSNEYYLEAILNIYLEKMKERKNFYFSEEGRKELEGLSKGFIYINDTMKMEKVKFSYACTDEIFKAYEKLIEEIGEYRFNTKWHSSYGYRQNNANNDILIDILTLKPVFIETLKNIDKFIDELKGLDYYNYSKLSEPISGLADLETKLNNTTKELNEAKSKYHMTWNFVQGRDCSYDRKRYTIERTNANLGKTKKEWRLKKNEACRVILDLYREMAKINVELCNREPWKHENLSSYYNIGLNYIIKSPNYYCYLTKKEIEKISKENKEKKLARKLN